MLKTGKNTKTNEKENTWKADEKIEESLDFGRTTCIRSEQAKTYLRRDRRRRRKIRRRIVSGFSTVTKKL